MISSKLLRIIYKDDLKYILFLIFKLVCEQSIRCFTTSKESVIVSYWCCIICRHLLSKRSSGLLLHLCHVHSAIWHRWHVCSAGNTRCGGGLVSPRVACCHAKPEPQGDCGPCEDLSTGTAVWLRVSLQDVTGSRSDWTTPGRSRKEERVQEEVRGQTGIRLTNRARTYSSRKRGTEVSLCKEINRWGDKEC